MDRLIHEAEAAGLIIEVVDSSHLRVRGPRSAAPLVRRISKHKGDLLAHLTGCKPELGVDRLARLPCTGRGAAGRVLGGGQSATAIAADRLDDDAIDLRLDAVDRAALEYLRGERFGDSIVVERMLTEPTTVRGVVIPAGWTTDHWTTELRRMADRCERIRPDRSRVLRADADRLAESCESGVDSLPLADYDTTEVRT